MQVRFHLPGVVSHITVITSGKDSSIRTSEEVWVRQITVLFGDKTLATALNVASTIHEDRIVEHKGKCNSTPVLVTGSGLEEGGPLRKRLSIWRDQQTFISITASKETNVCWFN